MQLVAKLQKPFTKEECLRFKIKYQINYALKDTEDALEAYGYTQEELNELEHNRVQLLSVTKSDFFDATIKAFGLDDTDLLPIVAGFISNVEVPDVMKKIALNNFKNAKDFYRNHEIFNVLAGKPIVINDQLTITITSEQFDNYFKKANQHDPEAYKELLP